MSDQPTREFGTSFKPHPGYDSPLIHVKMPTIEEFTAALQALEANAVPALVGAVDASVKAQWATGPVVDVANPVVTPPPAAAPAVTPPATNEWTAPPAGPPGPPPAANQPNPAAPATPGDGFTAPGGERRFCQHGVRVYKAGVNANTGAWAFFACPLPQGAPGNCGKDFAK